MEYHWCIWGYGCGVLSCSHCFHSRLFFLLRKGLDRKLCHVFVPGLHHCIHQQHACSMVVFALRFFILCYTMDASLCSCSVLSKSGCPAISDQFGPRTSGVHTQATAMNFFQRSQCIGWLLRVFALGGSTSRTRCRTCHWFHFWLHVPIGCRCWKPCSAAEPQNSIRGMMSWIEKVCTVWAGSFPGKDLCGPLCWCGCHAAATQLCSAACRG